MFFSPGLVFGGTDGVKSRFNVLRARTRFRRYRGVGSRFHVLRSQTHFRWYRGRYVPFSCLARPDSFSAKPRASISFFMFWGPGLVIDGTEGFESRFHVLCGRTRFRYYRGRRVPFSCFALPDSFSKVPRASGPFFMFCAPGLVFGGTEGVRFLFLVFLAWTHFWRYRGRQIPFSCFARPDPFSAVPRASGLFLMFCAPGLIFGGTEGVGSRFQVLQSRTHFRRYRGRRVPFSCFALQDSFSTVPRASGPCATLFRAPPHRRRAMGSAEEGHGDPSRACIC
jgi:hypothetical protein